MRRLRGSAVCFCQRKAPGSVVGLTFLQFECGCLLPTSAVTAEGGSPRAFLHKVGQYFICEESAEEH